MMQGYFDAKSYTDTLNRNVLYVTKVRVKGRVRVQRFILSRKLAINAKPRDMKCNSGF